ncbi:hypothetical protein [Saccharopolyspora hattusasensis]|uniref:hypothetical protein n=1 Tax=Saccharopolyspora hattusasensis TaxID=1128679 RepID=UPI003D983686
MSRIARGLGLTFDRSKTAAASAAKAADNRARRVALESRALSRVEAIYDRLEDGRYRFTATTVNGIETSTLDHVPAQDERPRPALLRRTSPPRRSWPRPTHPGRPRPPVRCSATSPKPSALLTLLDDVFRNMPPPFSTNVTSSAPCGRAHEGAHGSQGGSRQPGQ